MKKILIISSYFAPAWAYGGPPKVLFTLAKALTKLGLTINVITTDSLGEERSNKLEEEMDKIKIYRLRNFSNTLAYKSNFFYAPKIPGKIEEILEESDAVLFSDTRSIFNWQFFKQVKDKKIPYGIFAFGQIPRGLGIKSLVKKLFDLVWVTDFIRSATWRFAQTEHEQDMYRKYFDIPEDKTQLLPLPVENVNNKPDQTEVEKFRKKWQIGIHDKVIIFVGRINHLKGIDILIKSAEDLLRTDRHIKLLVVGRDDGYLKELTDIISEDIKGQIIFTGPLYGEDVETAYLCSSCFCITPRFYEETSTAALEALSYGLPVVTTKEAEIPFFSQYKAGFITNNASDIFETIRNIINANSDQKRQMSKEAKRCIADNFSSEKVSGQLIRILSKD